MGIRSELAKWLSGARKLVIMGIGNPMRHDDALGLELVRALRGRVPDQVVLLECGPVPENFLGHVIRAGPTHVLMVDAALIRGEPGQARLIGPEEAKGTAISTHKLPPRLLADLIRRFTGAEVAILAVRPSDVGFGEGLSPGVQEAIARLADLVSKVLEDVFSRSGRGVPRA